MSKPFRAGLLGVCLLLASTARLLVMAAGYLEDSVEAQMHATYFTADFLSSHFSYEAGRRFDSKPCAARVYASERSRSLRYLLGPTVLKAANYWKYLESKTKASSQLTVEFSVGFYMPFSAGEVYASLKNTLPTVDSSREESERELTADFDAYISMPSPYVDQTILNDPTHVALFEIVCFKAASKSKRKVLRRANAVVKQIKKTGLLEQGRQIREQQMIAAYLGEHHTQRTYSQRVLEDSKPRDGEEVYLLKLPEQSDPFYPGLINDQQWTFELVIKFLTYALPSLLKSHDNRSRINFFGYYLNSSGIIPGIKVSITIQQSEKTSPLFYHVFAHNQKYRFLEANSTISAMSYRESFIGSDVISPPVRRFTEMPSILLGTRRTLLHDREKIIYASAEIDFAVRRPVSLFLLQQLQMPFRIPKGLADEAAKRAEALRQLEEMTELNGLEENFDMEERMLALSLPGEI